ncbi:hypothetical protein AVEN_104684-1 [Araneus ventricosus]|uniref:Uncharacterized protein n=1 Tax=Araneus ventricosus TaxID=182803 RepID=A0A4Y2BDA9_ARAVE|nr:hypothetical protein AVEN_104684-1 [Araneus ventricosus]
MHFGATASNVVLAFNCYAIAETSSFSPQVSFSNIPLRVSMKYSTILPLPRNSSPRKIPPSPKSVFHPFTSQLNHPGGSLPNANRQHFKAGKGTG